MNTQEQISVKAKFGTEIRRFALPLASSFSTLEKTLGTVFSINADDKLVIKYLDDEGDLCIISTQQELDYAESFQSLLHVHLFLSNQVAVPQAQIHGAQIPQIPQFPQPVAAIQEIPEASRAQQFTERIQARRNQLEQKRNSILVELASESLRPDKKEFLTHKVQRIEAKIQFLDSRCEEQNQNHECKRDKRFPKHGLAGQPGPWGRGNRGECTGRGPRSGRECTGRGRHHDEDPVLFSLTEEARPRIMEARRNGDEAAVVAIQMEIMEKFQQHMSSKSQSF